MSVHPVMNNDIILSIENLYLDFTIYEGKVKVLDGVNLSVKNREIFGVVGETGCGKTVTFKSVIRLLEKNAVIDSGSVFYKKRINLLKYSEKEMDEIRGSKIATIFQEPMTALNPTMIVADQIGESYFLHFKNDIIKACLDNLKNKKGLFIQFHRKCLELEQQSNEDSLILKIISRMPYLKDYKKYLKNETRKLSFNILKEVDMPAPEKTAFQYPHELSGGMRQRVVIAIALACQPELLIADEPTTAVDVTTQAKILRLLLELRNSVGLSIVLITHNIGVVSEICDRVAVMYAGQVVEVGDVVDVLINPVHPYTIGLMSSIHHIGDKEMPEEIRGNVPILSNPPTGCRFHPRCLRSLDICRETKPETIEVHTGHFVACWNR